MNKTFFKTSAIVLLTALSMSCSKFDEINTDPNAANIDQVRVEYFLNNSIVGAQQDPHIAERVFVLYWKTLARQHFTTGVAGGSYNDEWSKDYWRYISEWLNNANTAIQVAEEKKSLGKASPFDENLVQVARIWRAYLLTEASDNFGPIPTIAFQGSNPTFNSVKDVYYYALEELKDASSKFNDKLVPDETLKKYDAAYAFDWEKWIRYANSMRMRLAMRIAEVDPAKAKSEFEAAVATNLYISGPQHNFKVQEKEGWNPLTGVMSRSNNLQLLSTSLNNLFLGLGGIKSENQLAASFKPSIMPENYIGLKFPQIYSSKTNDPSTGYWLNGLPNKIDPRAYKAFFIPGNTATDITPTATNTKGYFVVDKDTVRLDAKDTWNTFVIGDYAAKNSLNTMKGQEGRTPALAQSFRTSNNSRIFFASWESYFLIAEAALKGWTTPMDDQAAYNKGIQENFAYWKVDHFYADYINSEDYNRVGTSVRYAHTTEPGNGIEMDFKDGKTMTPGKVTLQYPSNTIYKGGSVKNDKLTKIITQKYISNMPWLPLEAWNDHRRLGLPFLENPAIENLLPNLPALNEGNYKKNQINFYTQRLSYPSSFKSSDPSGYQQAVQLLDGNDNLFTPLWWAKKN